MTGWEEYEQEAAETDAIYAIPLDGLMNDDTDKPESVPWSQWWDFTMDET